MATRLKTIEFATTADTTSLTAGTNRDKAIDIYIPETVVAFRNCSLQCYFRGNTSVAANLGATTLRIGTTSGFTTSSVSTAATPAGNSGESETWQYAFECSSFFTANWSGTSNTWYVRINTGSGAATINHSFKLLITYEYDDTSSTQIKTIHIPIESTRTLLTTSWQTIGGATAIPAVEGAYLPEASVNVRQAFLELGGNAAATSTGDFTIQGRIDGVGTTDLWFSEQALLGNGCYIYFSWDITGEDLSSARSLEATVATTTNRVDWLGGWLTVTYEFNPTTTTTVYNSLLLGAIDTTGYMGGTSSGDQDSWGRTIFIEEPGTITMKESGVFIGHNGAAGYTVNIAVGDQGTYTPYAATASSLQLGQYSFMHRIDSGGQNGTAFTTLQRGKNSYECRLYSSNSTDAWGVNGFLIINYTSSKATSGVGAHNHSCFYQLSDTNNDNYVDRVDSRSCPIPETSYWLTGVVTEGGVATDNSTNQSLSVNAERQSGEGEGEGWETIGVTQFRSDNENTFFNMRYASRKAWKRYPNDPDTDRLDIEATRSFRVDTGVLSTSWYGLWITYHAITFNISGSISGSGGGSVTIDAFRNDTGEKIDSATRSGDGAYSITWYDDTVEIHTSAHEDSAHVGRSDNSTAS